jgi:hypothetical protein
MLCKMGAPRSTAHFTGRRKPVPWPTSNVTKRPNLDWMHIFCILHLEQLNDELDMGLNLQVE